MNSTTSKRRSICLTAELADLSERGLLRHRRRVKPFADGSCEIDGRRLRNFAGNDYLNLAGDERVIEAARQAMAEYGHGSRASALVTGRTDWHERLEERIARFEGEESAVLFPTGYAANLGSIPALVGTGDMVFCDRCNHASLVDGCRLSGAKLRVYRHDRLDVLERELKKSAECRRRLIVTDGLFSMDGHAAPLPDLCDLSERHDAAILVDEAHATGVFGANGRGISEWQNVEERVAVRVGTLSKAIGALGGFVAGPRELTDWLFNSARTQMYSTALPPAVCAAAATALDIIEREPWRRSILHDRAQQLRSRLTSAELPTARDGVGPIVAVPIGDPDRTVRLSSRLEDRGFLVAGIRPPTVPRGTSRLRIALSCAHTEDDVNELGSALQEVLAE